LRSAPILFKQIDSNLASCIGALHTTFCIVSQIFGALYSLRPAPNFYEIHPRGEFHKSWAQGIKLRGQLCPKLGRNAKSWDKGVNVPAAKLE
jgi:hypothetical protein